MFYKFHNLEIFLLSLACIVRVCCSEGNETVDCTNEDSVTSVFNSPIALTVNGTILVYENVSINSLLSTANNEFDEKYIDARLQTDLSDNHTNLVIFTTEHFPRYAQEQTVSRIILKVVLGCGFGRERTLIFYLPIEEGNYFRPVFNRELYEILIPTPIFAGFDLTYFTAVSAKDDDLTGNQIEFSSPEALEKYHIVVTTKNITEHFDGKTYFASLVLERVYMSLREELRFEIIARDHGNPSLNSTATVVVRSDLNNSLPVVPEFEHSVYKATLEYDLTLTPLQISLTKVIDRNQTKFIVNGSMMEYFSLTPTDKGVVVTLAHTLRLADIKDKDYLELTVTLDHNKLAEQISCEILIKVPNFEEYFHFFKPIYEAYIDAFGILQMEELSFVPNINNEEIVYSLKGETQNAFTLALGNNSLILSLSTEFEPEMWSNSNYLTIGIEAALEFLVAETFVVVAMPRERIDLGAQKFEFEKPLYEGLINTQNELEMEEILFQSNNFNMEQITFHLSGNDSEFFDFVLSNQSIALFLTSNGRMELKANTLLLLTAAFNNLKAYASIAIARHVNASYSTRGIFQNQYYVGSIEVADMESQILHLDAINLKADYKTMDFEFRLNGDDAESFDVISAENNEIFLVMPQPLLTTTLDKKSQIILELSALSRVNSTISDVVPIFLQLPRQDCTALMSNLTEPVFESNAYVFAAKPDQIGSLGQISAYVQGSNVDLHYTLNIENEHLQKRLSINPTNGELLLLSYVSPGIYYFRINAETESLNRTSVAARLDVDSMLRCAEQHVSVANSLIVKHIEEEKEHSEVLSVAVGDCIYEIMHMYPNDKAYVFINDTTKTLSTTPIDREDVVFAKLTVPQLQVRLKLICKNENENSTLRTRRDVDDLENDQDWIFGDDIPHLQDLTIVNLILDDINDNAPVFVEPDRVKYLGYPSTGISFELFPQYLTHVQAVDNDTDLNARIKYSMLPNKHFAIDAASGIIYPKSHAMQTENTVEITVKATDREGASDGLSSELIIHVKKLFADHLTLLTLRGNGWESFEDVLDDLSAETKYSIKLLKQATLTDNLQEESRKDFSRKITERETDGSIVQQAWIYALNGNEPVLNEHLEKRLNAPLSNNHSIKVMSYRAVGLKSNYSPHLKPESSDSTDHAIYIAVIVVLSIIVCIIINFLLWRFYFRSKFTCNPKKSTSDCNLQVRPMKESSMQNSGESSGNSCETLVDPTETKETKMEPINLERRRSQVTFSDVVERIQIDMDGGGKSS